MISCQLFPLSSPELVFDQAEPNCVSLKLGVKAASFVPGLNPCARQHRFKVRFRRNTEREQMFRVLWAKSGRAVATFAPEQVEGKSVRWLKVMLAKLILCLL